MPEYADIYALADQRSEALIESFLDRFLPLREEAADEYRIPAYSDSPKLILKTDEELIQYCCLHTNEVHDVYWRGKTADEHAHIFFLSDGGLIVGVSIPAEDHSKVDLVSHLLRGFLSSDRVYVTYEDLPPETKDQFDCLLASLPVDPGEEARRTRAYRPIENEPSDSAD